MLRSLRRCGPLLAAGSLLGACGVAPVVPDDSHLRSVPHASQGEGIPAPVTLPPEPPEPKPHEALARYTVVVRQVPVQELLQAVARDAHVNIDIHPSVTGLVSLNAVDQTLPQILQRITRQTNARFRVDGPNLVVEPDTPFLRSYAIDYVNANRNSDAEIGASSQVSALSASGTGETAGGTGSRENVVTTSKHHFWETMVQNLKDLLREAPERNNTGRAGAAVQRLVETNGKGGTTTTAAASGAAAGAAGADGAAGNGATGNAASNTDTSAESNAGTGAGQPANGGNVNANDAQPQRLTGVNETATVIANPEAGIISVRATSRQHERVQEFIDRVMGSAHRQVLIEATVVEVTLSDNYKAGIDWTRLTGGALSLGIGDFAQNAAISTTVTNPGNGGLAVRYANGSVNAAINLLDTFGSTRVLSSPKLMALNNQTALLKVVDNLVYFNISSQFVPATNNSAAYAITTATPRSVSVGLIMAVTPQISAAGTVSLIVRPTISRVLNYVIDPSTAQNAATVPNLVPQIQVREMESILSVQSGQIAVLGGLMQQSVVKATNGVPLLGRTPVIGDLFNQHNDTSSKTELVVFLRPVVVDRQQPIPADSGMEIPDANFFRPQPANTAPASLQPTPLKERDS